MYNPRLREIRMTRSEIESLLVLHADAFGRLDAAALADQHTADSVFRSPAAGTVQGRDAIRRVYTFWFEAFPDMQFRWESPIIDDDRAALHWSLAGTMKGSFFGVNASGTRVDMTGAAFYAFRDGGIAEVSHIFDFSAVLIKVGVLKARPT
jgi:steroid delta-isomerase-like uncharacterized protein